MGPLLLLAATATVASPRIELITMGPGPELYSFWGHSAIRVAEPNGRDIVYNFGSVDFSGNFFMRMLRGQVDAYVSVSSYARTERAYVGEDRTFVRRVLDLEPHRAREVATELRKYVGGKRHTYRYHHFKDNCATRVADALDMALGHRLSKRHQASTRRSFRNYAMDTIRPHALYYVLIDLLITAGSDYPISEWEARFLPHVFDRQLDQAGVVAEKHLIHTSKSILSVDDQPLWPWTWIYLFFSLPLLALIWWRPRAGAAIWGAVSGLLGLAILLIWGVTNYDFTSANWNVLLIPVTHGLLFFAAFSDRLWARAPTYLAIHAAVAIPIGLIFALGAIAQSLGPALLFSLPPTFLLIAVRRSGKKATKPSVNP